MIGISSPNFSFLPFKDMLDKVRKEFKLWEIVLELEHDLPAIEKDIKYGIDSYGINFQAHGPIADLNIGSPSERMRRHSIEELTFLLGICDRCGIPLLTIHPGAAVAYGDDVKGRVRAATQRSIKEIDKIVSDLGVKVALENMPKGDWSIGYDYSELLSLIEGTSIGICFDIGHANTLRTIDTFTSDSKGKIINVHVHNNEGLSDQHLVLDEGNIDLSSIISSLGASYRGNYIIEARNFEEGLRSRNILSSWLGEE